MRSIEVASSISCRFCCDTLDRKRRDRSERNPADLALCWPACRQRAPAACRAIHHASIRAKFNLGRVWAARREALGAPGASSQHADGARFHARRRRRGVRSFGRRPSIIDDVRRDFYRQHVTSRDYIHM